MSSVSGPPPSDIFYKWRIAAGICIPLSALLFAARMASRWLQNHSFDASDATLFAALLTSFGADALTLAISDGQAGGSKFTDPSTPEQFAFFMKIHIAVECVYATSLACVKLSFLLLFRRLFRGKGLRIFTSIVGIIVIMWWFAIVLTAILECNPIYAIWDPQAYPSATCIARTDFYIGVSVPNIVTDLTILTIPQFFVWKLHVSLRAKFGLAFTFLLGGFATIASVIRFTTLLQINEGFLLWSMNPLGIWTTVELATAIVSASLPTLRPLVIRFAEEARSTFRSGSSRESLRPAPQRYKTEAQRPSHETAATTDHRNPLLAHGAPGPGSIYRTILATTTFGVSSEPKAHLEGGELVEPAEKPEIGV